MLSRVAESMFWMSRYIERAENTARFLEVNSNLLLDLNKIALLDLPSYWKQLILVTSYEEEFEKIFDNYSAETVTEFLVFHRQNPNSIYSCISLARENARSIIESISSEMWEQINNLYHYLQKASLPQLQNDPYNFYKEIKNGSHLFQGITDCTISRNEGWDFTQAGKFLERADNTARLVDVKYDLLNLEETDPFPPVDAIQWMAVLKSCSALEAFRKVYFSKLEPDTILRFLVLDRSFPRSIYFSAAAAEEALWRISGGTRRKPNNNADRLIGKMVASLSYTTIEDINEQGLHNYLDNLERRLVKIGEQVHQIYFAYSLTDGNIREVEVGFPRLEGSRAIWSQAEQQQQQ